VGVLSAFLNLHVSGVHTEGARIAGVFFIVRKSTKGESSQALKPR